ncbi:MAG: pirin family protein [Desulfobulbaceae bacterium]|nr:MAG: pirin family protein [Desulfobulbaceae bacterium]
MTIRTPVKISQSIPTLEGAGVHLRRAFGFGDTALFDPFLLFDDFRSDHPDQYLKGFPWHPHRGIETITYVLAGDVEHGDSLGNRGTISSGDVQWMTAGSGIIHQEMPKGDERGRMHGFQLWCNLPAAEKMCAPRYRDVTAAMIPTVTTADGAVIMVICGRVGETAGPVEDITIAPQYLDITVPAGADFSHPTRPGDTVVAYVIDGSACFAPDAKTESGNCSLLVFSDGDRLAVRTANRQARFLLFSGRPLREPVAWRGPIVMNTEEELQTAFREYHEGTFLKHR